MTSDPDDNVRVAAADALATFTTLGEFLELPEKTVRKLRTVLMNVINDASEPGSLRASALAAAAVRSEDDEIQDAVEAFFHSGEPELHTGAIQAMGRSGNSRWLPLLDTAVRSADPDVRQLAARSLGPFESEVVPLLTMLVREDPEGPVRIEAIQALGTVGGRKALESLQTLREYVSDDEIEAVDIAMSEAESLVMIDELDPDAELSLGEDDLY
jgi:HEAT repeat protein